MVRVLLDLTGQNHIHLSTLANGLIISVMVTVVVCTKTEIFTKVCGSKDSDTAQALFLVILNMSECGRKTNVMVKVQNLVLITSLLDFFMRT